MCKKIKEAVFIIGPNAIEDLLGCELEFDTDDDLSEAMDNALNQMPEDIIWDFYHKYCCD